MQNVEFYKNNKVSIRVDGKLSILFDINIGIGLCYITMAV